VLLTGLMKRTSCAEVTDSIKIRPHFVFAGYAQYGRVLATNPYLKLAKEVGDTKIEYDAFSLQVLKQTTGEKEWEKHFGYPIYGAGVYSAQFFDNKGFGAPVAVYGVLKGPFTRWEKLTFNYDTGFGIAFNWNSYNPAANNFNISLGANQSVFIDLGINLKYPVSQNFDLSFGYSFTHFSNGAMKVPNFGLNTFSPKITLVYNIERFIPPRTTKPDAPFRRNTTIDISFFGGLKNVVYTTASGDSIPNYRGVFYQVYGLNTVINRQVTPKSKIGFGWSLTYDASYNSTAYIDHGELEPAEGFQHGKMSLSIFPSYELVINRLSVVMQPGFYIFRKQSVDKNPLTYQRLGLHYLIGDNFLAGVCLRAYSYHISDYIEWTVGYRLAVLSHGKP